MNINNALTKMSYICSIFDNSGTPFRFLIYRIQAVKCDYDVTIPGDVTIRKRPHASEHNRITYLHTRLPIYIHILKMTQWKLFGLRSTEKKQTISCRLSTPKPS